MRLAHYLQTNRFFALLYPRLEVNVCKFAHLMLARVLYWISDSFA